MGVLISMSPTGLADTLDAPGQFATLGVGSAPCFTVIKAVGKTAHFKEADSQAMPGVGTGLFVLLQFGLGRNL